MSRGHVLDVKLRSDQVRASRIRLGALALGGSFGTLFGLYLFWRVGEWTLDRFVYENPVFAIQLVDVRTDGVIAKDQLQRWAGVKLGQNLMALDLAGVKRNLELVSLIGDVSVERVLPRTLRILVNEREPVAQINVPRANARGTIEVAVFQLDREGYVMEPLDPRRRVTLLAQVDDQLPVIGGVNPLELKTGHRVESPPVQAALDLIERFEHSPMAGLVDLQRIDVSSAEVLIAKTGDGSEVTFGLKDLDQQLRRWRAVYDSAQRLHKTIATLDLAVANNIPARWLEAGAAPPPAPKAPKTLRPKK